MGRGFGWRPSVCPKDAFAGGRSWQKKEPRNLPGRCACIKRKCCSRLATPTWMPLQSGGRSSEGRSVDTQSFSTCVLKLFLSHCCHDDLPWPAFRRRRDRFHPAVHRRSSRAEPLEVVAATL